ncbi:MAG: TonB-dependent receptor, partial [Saprospiraceae bacterium]|nr:TonB-dependent receptor [Saprospiraceae bacterium]
VNTLTAANAQLHNPQTTADLLGSSGKVFIQKSQQGGGSPMIRGFATNRLLYAVDGVRMNTAIFRSGNLQNVISLDPFAIEKTDIYFGPGSVIYGSDAIGGVMSFNTLDPKFTPKQQTQVDGSTTFRYATANKEKTGHAHVNIGLRKWAFLSSISYSEYDDLLMGKKGPQSYLRPFYVERKNGEDVVIRNENPRLQNPSGYNQINLMQKIKYQLAENWIFRYGFHYSTTSHYARYDRHIRYHERMPLYGEWDYGPQKWMMNHLQLSHQSKSRWFNDLVIRLAQQEFQESRIDRNINDPIRRIRSEKVKAYSVNVDLLKKINERKHLFYGIEAVLNRVISQGSDENINTEVSQVGPARYPQADWTSLGAYLTYQSTITQSLSWQSGLRFNENRMEAEFDTTFYPFPFTHTKIDHRALTGSLGLVFKPSSKWILSANAATGFRAPNVDDIGKVFDSAPGLVVIPNPNLKAEIAYNLELSVAKLVSKSIKVDFSAYYTLLDNAMVRRDFALNGADSIYYDGVLSRVQAIQNAALGQVYGIQAGIEVRLPAGLILTSDINLQNGEEETDDGITSPSRHAPPAYGITRLQFSEDAFEVQLYAVYSGGKSYEELALEERLKSEIYAVNSDGLPHSPSWYTLNFKGAYKFSESVAINIGIENMTNQRYRPYSSGIAGAGRNLVISLRANI